MTRRAVLILTAFIFATGAAGVAVWQGGIWQKADESSEQCSSCDARHQRLKKKRSLLPEGN